jgi:hypothetical protein
LTLSKLARSLKLTFLKLAALAAIIPRNLHKNMRAKSAKSADLPHPFPPYSHILKKSAEETTTFDINFTNRFLIPAEKVIVTAKMSAHKPKRSRARFARSQADISALSSSEERSDREMEQERRFRGSCPHSTASLPPQNRSPIQHTACFMASTTGKLVYKYGMNRWCNYDSSDPSFDRLTNPCIPGDCFHQKTKTIDPVLSTDPDTSYSSVGSNLASLLKPVEVNQNLDGYPNFESILNNDDVQILPVQSLEAT